jgi:RNA polymerase sigma factor (sigma-70 family)
MGEMAAHPEPMRLVATAGEHADTSFEEFFAAKWGRLFRSLLLLTGSAQEAEDLTQGAFLRLLERWDSLRHDDLEGYLFRTALNAHRSFYRRTLLGAKRTLVPGSAHDDPFEKVAAHEGAVQSLLRLTARQRAAIVLTGVEGCDYHTAASLLGVKEATVRALVAQARRRLATEMETDDA